MYIIAKKGVSCSATNSSKKYKESVGHSHYTCIVCMVHAGPRSEQAKRVASIHQSCLDVRKLGALRTDDRCFIQRIMKACAHQPVLTYCSIHLHLMNYSIILSPAMHVVRSDVGNACATLEASSSAQKVC